VVSASGHRLRVWGTAERSVKFSDAVIKWPFLLADVAQPLLGADFLEHHGCSVDFKNKQLIFPVHPSFEQGRLSDVPSPLKKVNFVQLLEDFPDITATNFRAKEPKHHTRHSIEVEGPPIAHRARRLDPEKLQAAKAEFAQMEAAGIIRRSDSPWSSPLHMVKKPNGEWRPCGDYRRLNAATTPSSYPVPNLLDFTAQLQGSRIFSKIDLIKGYYQVPMSEDDIRKTAVITPFGLWEFCRMPFGLRNSGCTFQRMMDEILGDLPFCFIYVDDLLVASKDDAEHRRHLETIFRRLQEAGLVINPEKCEFGRSSVEFLGHRVTSDGVSPLPEKVSAICDMPPPQDVKALQRFLGMLNFYRRFLPSLAKTIAPLTDLTSPSRDFEWGPEQDVAFQEAKKALAAATTLAHPLADAVLSLAVDASATHVGAVLHQKDKDALQPLAFYSRRLSGAELNYSAFDRELLAVYSAIRHFRFLLEAREFTIWTDHKPLVDAIRKKSPPWTPRQQRHLAYVSEFSTDIRHIAGVDNVVADCLSRPPEPVEVREISPAPTPPPSVDFSAIAEEQRICPDLAALRRKDDLQIVPYTVENGLLWCDVSTGMTRPVIPASFRQKVLMALHQVSHPGIRAMRRLVTSRFLWPSMNTDAAVFVRNCMDCQRSKVQQHTRPPLEKFEEPVRRFSHIHIDLVGPLPQSRGCTHLLTVVDRSTRWPEAIPLAETSASTCARALLSQWIARFGVPSQITSDRGSQFASQVWEQLCTLLGMRRIMTTAYHPQANGLVERFHRSLKAALRARLSDVHWRDHLPLVLLGLRTVPRDEDGVSCGERVYGSPLSLPGEFLDVPEPPSDVFLRRLHDAIEGTRPLVPRPPPTLPVHLPEALDKCKFVFVRREGVIPPLVPRYDGPYEVLGRRKTTFRLRIGNRTDTVNVSRLKPAVCPDDAMPAQPPARGRPRLLPIPGPRRPRGRPRKL